MLHKRYYIEKEKQEKLLARKNEKSDFYNGVFDRYEYQVLTREHIPLTWRYDLNPDTNPYFMERLGINADELRSDRAEREILSGGAHRGE